ncbi:Uncharacterized protein Fot_24531 [Forsythia ovata]|uniref:Uncharacterized protein n=1 Tax=Forsythia ovata TaxID=205694 RepID=A0ABD1U7J7_9LAMI
MRALLENIRNQQALLEGANRGGPNNIIPIEFKRNSYGVTTSLSHSHTGSQHSGSPYRDPINDPLRHGRNPCKSESKDLLGLSVSLTGSVRKLIYTIDEILGEPLLGTSVMPAEVGKVRQLKKNPGTMRTKLMDGKLV